MKEWSTCQINHPVHICSVGTHRIGQPNWRLSPALVLPSTFSMCRCRAGWASTVLFILQLCDPELLMNGHDKRRNTHFHLIFSENYTLEKHWGPFSWLHHSNLTQHINSVNLHTLCCNPSNTTQDVSHVFLVGYTSKKYFYFLIFCSPHLLLSCMNMIWFMLLMIP